MSKQRKSKVPNLVVLEKDRYSFFEGKEKVVSVAPIDKEYLEGYRVNPAQIQLDIDEAANAPKVQMTEISTDELNYLLAAKQFLDVEVLQGKSPAEWIEAKYGEPNAKE